MPTLLERLPEEYLPALAAPLEGRLVPSPYNFEFTGEDALRLTVHNSQPGVVVALHYRMKPPAGSIHASAYAFAPAADRSASATEFAIGLGYLLNVTLFCSSGAPTRGQTFARLQVIRGRGAAAVVLGTVVQGYITGNQDRAWPGSPLEGSLEGDGYVRFIIGTAPAATSECRETVPTGARWDLLSVVVELTTSAVAGTRRPNVGFDDGVTRHVRTTNPGTLTAGLTASHYWVQGLPLDTVIGGESATAGLPVSMRLIAAHAWHTMTGAMQAGDQYGAPRFMVREWLEAQ